METNHSTWQIFRWSVFVTIAALVVAYAYGTQGAMGGLQALLLCLILGALEVSLSFDNAVINATVLKRMSDFWQRIFLTVGIVIAVFGMRLVFPLAIVWVTAGLSPVEAFSLALNPPADGASHFPDGSASYETLLTAAHPQIAAFGGAFLMMLFLNFVLDGEREVHWLAWLERPLGKAGKLDMLTVVFTGGAVLLAAYLLADDDKVLTVVTAGFIGMMLYIVVNGLGNFFHPEEHAEPSAGGPSELAKATGKAGFFLFMYLEVLDASFSFDGVIGAFAITADPIIIALGLGFIGAMYVRSITVYLVKKGTLDQYVYLEHGAYWAIGALAAILLITVGHIHVPELVTGSIGVAIIFVAIMSSIRHKRRQPAVEIAAETATSPEELMKVDAH